MTQVLTGERLRHFRHELRTPLNHIVGFADVLIGEAEDDGCSQLLLPLREIHAAGMALLDALQMALPGETETLDAADLVEAASILRPRIAGLLALCTALEQAGSYREGEEGLVHLQTISSALHQMSAILSSGITNFA